MEWLFATLKQYPEIAIFLTLALGYYFGKFTFKGIGLGAVTATLLAGVLIGQIGITISQPLKATGLPHVPVRRRLRRRAAVRPRHREGWGAAGDLRGGPVRLQPAGPRRHLQAGRLRPRLLGRVLLGIADALRRDGALDRRHQPAGHGRRPGQGPDRLDAGRLRRDLHVRHRGLGDRHRFARAQAARHRSCRPPARTTRTSTAARRRWAGLARPGNDWCCARSA